MSKTDDTAAKDKGDVAAAEAIGVLRGTYLWCVWGAIAFALCAWWIMDDGDEPANDSGQTEATP